jgi:DNA-binding beta-propeller fold protein YncE
LRVRKRGEVGGGKTAYVLNFLHGTVTPIRTATNIALPPIKVGLNPGAIAISP